MGTGLKDVEMVSKVMRSLSSRFVHVVTSVGVRDISKLSLDELSRSLQIHEARFNQFLDRYEDKAFVTRVDISGGRNFMRGRNYRGNGKSKGKAIRDHFAGLVEVNNSLVDKGILKQFNEIDRHKVKLGDDKEVEIMGISSVTVTLAEGNVKLIHGVKYVPTLAHNLLSVGLLLDRGYDVVFSIVY
ncbi:uncharacterized protein LOC120268551 [Dioscorea cayenensis subsp. rotundata]|uniref:Uncharacterized protein LOC120268551 n=1 Tax=Dioscorea cayennensis subsp. rotundata TaxID=55577 RepID=A0AB40BWI8_DIOCR|nr:uncharacterized protein LOC120268551 [Dioscorea cayenensis subsp. rotundata]